MLKNAMTQPVLSVDIGGTKILAALVSPGGEVLASDHSPTPSQEGYEAILERVESAARRLIHKSGSAKVQPTAAAVAVAGVTDVVKGIVTTSPNLPLWRDVPLKTLLEQRLGLETFLLNDARAAALGEHRVGAGRGASNMVFITVSTGIGGGIIIGGQLYQGTCGAAGEIGHMVIDVNGPRCGCGNKGCLEALASGTAIAREATERLAHGIRSSIPQYAGGSGDITAQAVAAAAGHGDRLAQGVISRAARYLGVGLANLINIFNPEVVVVGGGVAKMGEMLLKPARRVMRQKAFKLPASVVRIVPAQLGAEAGVIGAAMYALECRSVRRAPPADSS
ncbi:MAG: ROK family protein [Chloroflexota bacterium]